MESFYGGKTGASFIIVKRFDGIDIPQPDENGKYTYTKDAYLVDSSSNFIIKDIEEDGAVSVGGGYLIKKTSTNYKKYNTWALHENNGEKINNTDYSFPTSLAEGMVQCFEQGASTTSEVNYGEYVIIDTLYQMNDQNDYNNGKVYRRGLDIQNSMAGGEYVGHFTGPQGQPSALQFLDYNSVEEQGADGVTILNVESGGLVPGYNGVTGESHDSISYVWKNIEDSLGNTQECLVGLKIPYVYLDFVGYAENTDYDGNFLIPDNKYYDEKTGTWKNPFHQKWEIHVPRGANGKNIDSLEVIPTKTKPAGYTAGFIGAQLFSDVKCLSPLVQTTGEYVYAANSLDVDQLKYDISPATISAPVIYNDTQCYVKKSDCYQTIMRSKEISFDNTLDGEIIYQKVAGYSNLEKIDLTDEGTMNFYLGEDAENPAYSFDNVFRSINDIGINTTVANGYEGSGTQKVHIQYNNGEVQEVGNPLNYIIEARVCYPIEGYLDAPYGHLLVYYADPTYREKNKDRFVTYPSLKYEGRVLTQWVDLGNVSFNSVDKIGGFHFLKKVSNIAELGQTPPEQLMVQDPDDSTKTVQATWAAGWLVTAQGENGLNLYAYNYENRSWYRVGSIDSASSDPSNNIIISEASPEKMPGNAAEALYTNGVWFGTEKIYSAY